VTIKLELTTLAVMPMVTSKFGNSEVLPLIQASLWFTKTTIDTSTMATETNIKPTKCKEFDRVEQIYNNTKLKIL
jgi:hypothetical protein